MIAVNNGQTVDVDAHGVCRKVTNSGGPRTMVPIRTAAEWASFRSGAPGHISFATCVPPCGGWSLGGFCWYWAAGTHCANICASRGGYNEGTRTYAGSEGTNGNCYTLLNHFIGAGAFAGVINNSYDIPEGCAYYSGYTCDGANTRGWRVLSYTTADAQKWGSSTNRACACNN